jgi:hypothetical protein
MMQVHWRIAISFLISRIKFPELIVGGWYNGDWSWPDSRCPTAFRGRVEESPGSAGQGAR